MNYIKMIRYNFLKYFYKANFLSLKNISLFETQKLQRNDQFQLKNMPSLNILSLEELIESRNRNNPRDLFQNNDKSLFEYGTNPLRLRNQLFVFFKYSYWQQNKYGEQKIISFVDQMESQAKQIKQKLKEDPNNQEHLSKYKKIKDYRKQISIIMLPSVIAQMKFCEKYIQILMNYLDQETEITQFQMHFIFENLDRIIFNQGEVKQFKNDKDYGWMLSYTFDKFIDKINPFFNGLSGNYKQILILIAKSLRSSSLSLLQFVKKQLQQQKKQINMQCFLSGLNYLAINRCFPYEYFYKNKQSLMSIIQSAQNLSEKKVQTSKYMLEIFSRERLMYCQKIINRLLICIQQNLQAADISQIVSIFYFYSRLKCSIKHQFVVKIVQKIYQFMGTLNQIGYSMIIKAISSLNYQDLQLIETLKLYNYQLFLSNLKYQSDHLGQFYKKIIEEVQSNFKNDQLRYYRPEDESFNQQINQTITKPSADNRVFITQL